MSQSLGATLKFFNIAMLLMSKYLYNNCNKGGYLFCFPLALYICLHVCIKHNKPGIPQVLCIKRKHLLNHGKAHGLFQTECSPLIVQMVACFLFGGRHAHTERGQLFSNPMGPQLHLTNHREATALRYLKLVKIGIYSRMN